MNRRACIVVLGIAVASTPWPATAQTSPLPVVVFISNFGPGDTRWNIDAFIAGLTDAGYTDGRNVRLVMRYADGRVDRLAAAVAEAVALQPAVIVASGYPAAHRLKEATRSVPVVLALISDPQKRALVHSLSHPEGNITGLVFQSADLARKRLELMRDVVPGLRRIAILAEAEEQNFGVPEGLQAARALGLDATVQTVLGPADFAAAFSEMQRTGRQGMVVLASPMLNANRRPLIDGAARLRLPATWETRAFVQDGGLMSYGPSVVDMYRRSASYVDRLLHGQKPSDLPMEQASRFELVINRTAARALGLALPDAVLLRADDVIG